jgi:four helix bundle protein
MNTQTRSNPIVEITFKLSIKIVSFTEQLNELKKYNLANQLFRSGTSIGANVREAQAAESIPDFIHKLRIAAKEAQETDYWLSICKESELYPYDEELSKMVIEISKLLSSIISTTKKRYNK